MPDSDLKAKRIAAKARKTIPAVVSTVVQLAVGPERLPAGWIGGVDTDFWAGPYDFQKLKDNGGKFAFIRAGEKYVDSQFRASWAASKGVVPRGAYWFLTKDPAFSIGGQARLFASLFPNGYDPAWALYDCSFCDVCSALLCAEACCHC